MKFDRIFALGSSAIVVLFLAFSPSALAHHSRAHRSRAYRLREADRERATRRGWTAMRRL